MESKLDPEIDLEIYNSIKNEEKFISCDKCKHTWNMKDTDIKQTGVETKEGVIQLTYFTCTECGKLYIISIEDEQILEYKRLLNMYLDKLKVLNSYNLLEKAKQYQVLISKRTRLLRTRIEQQGKFYQK